MRHDPALDPVRRAARPLDDLDDVDAVVQAAASAKLVLLGDVISHRVDPHSRITVH